MGVPTMYSYLLCAYDAMAPEQQAAARAAAGRLRLTVSGSAACPLPVMQRWEELSGSGSLLPGADTACLACLATCMSDAREWRNFCGKLPCMASVWLTCMLVAAHFPAKADSAAVMVVRHAGQRLLERYGMTETNMILSNPYEGERRPGYVGLPLPDVEVRAVADSAADEEASTHAS